MNEFEMPNPDASPGIVKTEPAVTVGTLIALVGAVFVLLRLYFPDVFTPDLEHAVSGVLLIGLPLVTSFLIRARVWPSVRVIEGATAAGYIVAGEANEALLAGDIVRPVGSMAPGLAGDGDYMDVDPDSYIEQDDPARRAADTQD